MIRCGNSILQEKPAFIHKIVSGKTFERASVLNPTTDASINADVGGAIADKIAEILVASNQLKVLDRAARDQIWQERNFQISSGEIKADQIREVGHGLGADYIVVTKVIKVGSLYSMSAKIINVESLQVVASASDEADASLESLLKLASRCGDTLMTRYLRQSEGMVDGAVAEPSPPEEPATFTLKVTGPTAGMDVVVDGRSLGKTPLSLTLTRGNHKIGINHPDYQSWQGTVDPAPEEKAVMLAPKIEHTVAWQLSDLHERQRALSERIAQAQPRARNMKTVETTAWIISAIGAAVSAGGYLCGLSSRNTYDQATTASAATQARSATDVCNVIFQTGFFSGTGGLAVGLGTLIFTPNTAAMTRDLNAINAKIAELEGQP